VAEDALVGTSVAHILATDADQGLNGRVRYELKGTYYVFLYLLLFCCTKLNNLNDSFI
jgi:hypothetical protein